MAMNLTAEQRELGKANFQRVVGQLGDPEIQPQLKGLTRRDFMKGLLAAAGAAAPISAAVYFGYESAKSMGKPVKTALIGSGDEGNILVNEHNPDYLEFVAIADIRPSNRERVFAGDSPWTARRGFERLKGYGGEARQKIKAYDDYRKVLEDPDIEAVVIALPLHLHARVSIEAMEAGKHVLCEKLMAWNIKQCKEMIAAAAKTDRILSIGHQRHYSLLYAHAVEVLSSGALGDFSHIRALWHRNNTVKDSWRPEIKPADRDALEKQIRELGYKNLEELVRWRLYNRTGGGLMAELGSHQLDACSIFLTANAKRHYAGLEFGDFKLQPLAVSGVGGKHFYTDEREVDDHVYVTFEFPGDTYWSFDKGTDGKAKKVTEPRNPHDLVVVTYSSINTNANEPYGEMVMGTRGTLIIEKEQDAILFAEAGAAGRSTAVGVAAASGGQAVLDTSASTGGPASAGQAIGQRSMGYGPPSRGYREEMEHFAWLIRMRDQAMSAEREKLKPRCDGKAAMADAIMALTSNLAIRKKQRIEFDPDWFDPESPKVPDADVIPETI